MQIVVQFLHICKSYLKILFIITIFGLARFRKRHLYGNEAIVAVLYIARFPYEANILSFF